MGLACLLKFKVWNIQKDRFDMMNYYFKNENLEIELET